MLNLKYYLNSWIQWVAIVRVMKNLLFFNNISKWESKLNLNKSKENPG
jgi:hypothetical protein